MSASTARTVLPSINDGYDVVSAEGIAELSATGRTGHPDYAIKRPSSGTPYSYRIKASFEESRATGSRIDSRPCSFTAMKRPSSQRLRKSVCDEGSMAALQ